MVPWPNNQLFKREKVKGVSDNLSEAELHGKKSLKAAPEMESLFDQGAADVAATFGQLPHPAAYIPTLSSNAALHDIDRAALSPPPRAAPSPLPLAAPSPSPMPITPAPSPSTTIAPAPPNVLGHQKDKDPRYVKEMNDLVALIHKANGEWNRKSREYAILHTKAQNHPLCKGSQLINQMKSHLDAGDTLDKQLQFIEEKFALDQYVDGTEQIKAKYLITELQKTQKDLAKVKFHHVVLAVTANNKWSTCGYVIEAECLCLYQYTDEYKRTHA